MNVWLIGRTRLNDNVKSYNFFFRISNTLYECNKNEKYGNVKFSLKTKQFVASK